MSTDPPIGRLRRADLSETAWLGADGSDGFLGYAPIGWWPAETWVLHGMWEDPAAVAPRSVEQRWRDEHPGQDAIGILAYENAMFTDPPPVRWRRLRWAELAARLGEPLGYERDGHPVPPSYTWFPVRSWPESIRNPSEGTIDAPTGERLVELLAEHTAGGLDAPCYVFYDILDSPYRLERVLLAGPLRAVFDSARLASVHAATADNIWPADRSWLLWTEHDLWGTRLVGPAETVAAVDADPELETVPFIYRRAPPPADR